MNKYSLDFPQHYAVIIEQELQYSQKYRFMGEDTFGCQVPQVILPFDPLEYPVPETWQLLSSFDLLQTC